MRTLVVTVALLATALAGCSDSGSTGSEPADVSDLGLKASETTGVIVGVVVDDTITPVADADVVLVGSDKNTTTNEQGAFGFEGIEPGSHFLKISKAGHAQVQQSVEVVAGVDTPPVVRVLLERMPETAPFVDVISFQGFLACGVAVVATSLGCTTVQAIADATSSASVFDVEFERVPDWAQGELVWEHNQPAGGQLIWEMVVAGTNDPVGYRETTTSPALAYWDTGTLEANEGEVLSSGIAYRFFGGPHELCTTPDPVPANFGCGVTLEQETQIIIHNFYNTVPEEGWRFTADGDPPLE